MPYLVADMNTPPSIRPATVEDAAAMAVIFNQYLARATMVLLPRTAADFKPIVIDHHNPAFVTENEAGQVNGYAYVKPYSDRRGYSLAGEISVFLDENATGNGLGNTLYRLLIPAANECGYRHLTAKIWANNGGSIRFHARHGFRMVGTQVGIGLVDGKRVDTVLMERVW